MNGTRIDGSTGEELTLVLIVDGGVTMAMESSSGTNHNEDNGGGKLK
jgi:hypothetical protein